MDSKLLSMLAATLSLLSSWTSAGQPIHITFNEAARTITVDIPAGTSAQVVTNQVIEGALQLWSDPTPEYLVRSDCRVVKDIRGTFALDEFLGMLETECLLERDFYFEPADNTGRMFRVQIPAGLGAFRTFYTLISRTNIQIVWPYDQMGRAACRTSEVEGIFQLGEVMDRLVSSCNFSVVNIGDDIYTVLQGPRDNRPRVDHAPDSELSADNSSPPSEVIVTGTLIRNSGVQAISSPLLSIGQTQIRRSRYATVQDALRSAPMFMRSRSDETFDSPSNFGRAVAANLRGLGAGATLVLVNGRRQAASGADGDFVDLNSIPWSAVKQIDVLPDGSSALYGSDAVAGVINVILRNDRHGAETTARAGTTIRGAEELLASHLSGFSWAAGGLNFAYQYSERGALAARERSYSASGDQRSHGGTDFRSFRSAPGNILSPITLLPAYGIPSDVTGRLTVPHS